MTRTEKIRAAKTIAAVSSDGYSYSRYRPGTWNRLARALIVDYNYSPESARQILLSKFMRWCADSYNKNFPTFSYTIAWLMHNRATRNDIDRMLITECGLVPPVRA